MTMIQHPEVALAAAAIAAYDDDLAVERARFFITAARGRPEVADQVARKIELELLGQVCTIGVYRLGPRRYRLEIAGRWSDVGVETPQGQKTVVVKKGLEPKAVVSRIFHGEATFSREATHDARSLADALRIELREVLREDDAGVYGVSVSATLADRPRQRRTTSISFGCDPKRVDALLAELDRVLERFRRQGPRPETVAKAREAQRREREVSLRENDFWSGALANYLTRGWDPLLILRYDELLARVTVERIRDTAKTMLDPSRSVLAELLPEG